MTSQTHEESRPTWVARLTPKMPSAIATLAVQGPQALNAVSALVKIKSHANDPFPLGRVRYGLWNPVDEQAAAEQIVVCRTDQETIEINCHGGNAVCQMIVHDLVSHGCVSVTAADFPIDLACDFKREAVVDLQRATTCRAAEILLDQFNGALSDAVARLTTCCLRDGTDAVRAEVKELLRWSDLGLHLIAPWKVVLAGPPNAGKSSLMNAVVGNMRMIVHHEPGTTRDWVEMLTAIDGWPVALTDTAGLRESTDAIESEGIRRAMERVEAADLVVFVVDATVGWTDTHERLRSATGTKRTLTVWNKIDLWNAKAAIRPVEAICTSANDGRGITELLDAIARTLVRDIPPPMAAIPFRIRHVKLLESLIAN